MRERSPRACFPASPGRILQETLTDFISPLYPQRMVFTFVEELGRKKKQMCQRPVWPANSCGYLPPFTEEVCRRLICALRFCSQVKVMSSNLSVRQNCR